MKWTKKDVRTMCQTISSFWLMNRPLGDSMHDYAKACEAVQEYLKSNRTKVVLRGIAELESAANERMRRDVDMVEHIRAHQEVYGSGSDEMIERFSKLSTESWKDAEKARKLMSKIEAEGLPAEVIAFQPA